MKKIYSYFFPAALVLIIFFLGLSSDKKNQVSSNVYYKKIDANKIRTRILNDGQFDRKEGSNPAGFEWPKDSGKFAVYSSGLWLSAKINDSVRIAIAMFGSAFKPGYFDYNTQLPGGQEDPAYRIYKVSPERSNGDVEFDAWNLWPVNQGAPCGLT